MSGLELRKHYNAYIIKWSSDNVCYMTAKPFVWHYNIIKIVKRTKKVGHVTYYTFFVACYSFYDYKILVKWFFWQDTVYIDTLALYQRHFIPTIWYVTFSKEKSVVVQQKRPHQLVYCQLSVFWRKGSGLCVSHFFILQSIFFSGEFVALDPFAYSPSTISPLYNISHSNQLIPQYTKKRSKKMLN